MHIVTLCITISLCATVALACLFSPKVYIILMHPEKNMRLAKQLKAQAYSMKFASQLPTNADFLTNHNSIRPETSKAEGEAKAVANHAEESKQLLPSNPAVTADSSANHSENSTSTVNHSVQTLPVIVTINQLHSCASCEQQKRTMKSFDESDVDSLESSSMNEEPIMV